MLKKMILAAVPMMFLVSISTADDFLADFDASAIQDADISIEEAGFDVDFDKLADDAQGEGDEAIEACFRRIGYSGFRGYGFRGYGYGGYGYNCYRPYYSCYRPIVYRTCYRPVVYQTCYTPVYRNYWGCW